MIETIAPYIIDANGKLRSFTRGDDGTKGKVSGRFDSLSTYWVDAITNTFDQDVSALWVGQKGTGKSSAVLSVCYHSAIKIADWRNDGSKWDEYYNLGELTACILEEDATRLMNVQRPYVCKNFDDIGLGWNARDWQDDDNQQKNDVFQINRTDRALQCFSVPSQFLLDKVPRSLVNHYVEMDQQLFTRGYTTIKMFKPKTMFREGKIINPFLVVDRNKFVNYLIPAPPHDLWTEYKKLRNRNKDTAIRRRNDQKIKKDETKRQKAELEVLSLKKKQERLLPSDKGQALTDLEKKHRDWDNAFVMLIPDLIEMQKKRGKPMNSCLPGLAREHGLSDKAALRWRNQGLIQKYNLDKSGSA